MSSRLIISHKEFGICKFFSPIYISLSLSFFFNLTKVYNKNFFIFYHFRITLIPKNNFGDEIDALRLTLYRQLIKDFKDANFLIETPQHYVIHFSFFLFF